VSKPAFGGPSDQGFRPTKKEKPIPYFTPHKITTTSPQIAPACSLAYEMRLDRQLTRAFLLLYHLQLMQAAESLPIL